MSQTQPEVPIYNRLLSQTARLLRRARMFSARSLARAMGMERRTYYTFEAGGGASPSLERIRQLANALDADEYAIWAAIMISSPAFALRAADNKLMTAFLISLREFDEAAGDDMRLIDTLTLVKTFERTFDGLLEEAKRQAVLHAKLRGALAAQAETDPRLD